jgi:hypothetical protein
MDLATLQLQGAIDQGVHARKAFFDATHGKQGGRHGLPPALGEL